MNWKALAIFLIIITILQFLFIIWAYNYGTDLIEKENECIYNICSNYTGYYFDIDDVCYCYKDGEIVYEEYVR